jgi:ParB-like chromosome segregation protein Spo0J
MDGVPPLMPLHPNSSLSAPKLTKYDRFTPQELIDSLRPGLSESLKVRPDGTILNGHHRIHILRARGVDVDRLPREVVEKDPPPEGE